MLLTANIQDWRELQKYKQNAQIIKLVRAVDAGDPCSRYTLCTDMLQHFSKFSAAVCSYWSVGITKPRQQRGELILF